jgi:hypothetical protein
MSKPLSRAPIDTLYPLSPAGHPYKTVPAPLTSDLQSRLTEIGKQDVGPKE